MTGAISGYGTLLKLGDGGSPEAFATIAEVGDLKGPKRKAETIEVTSHSSPGGAKEFIPTLLDNGEVTFDVNLIPTDSTHSAATGLESILAARSLRNFRMVLPNVQHTTYAFAAYVTGFEIAAPVGGKLTASLTLKISGAVAQV